MFLLRAFKWRVIVLTGKRRALKRTEEELKKGALYNTVGDGVRFLMQAKRKDNLAIFCTGNSQLYSCTLRGFSDIYQAESIKASGFLCTAKAILSLQKSDLR